MKRHLLPVLLLALSLSVACSRPEPAKTVTGNAQVQGHYDPKTGKLVSITYDSNKNGKIDTWSYMDGARVIRIEIDKDEDGKLDRWEYYTADQKLEKVGWSRANNGKPDAWAYQGADGKIARIDLAALESPTQRVGAELASARTPDPGHRTPDDAAKPRIVRTEFYENGTLARVEEDTNGDGKTDKWETWRDGSIAAVAFDTAARGTPDRRLLYGRNGKVTVEVDPGGSGVFKPGRKPR